MLSLSIQHNIHLTREQRYSLHDGKDVETIGWCIPIWTMGKITSEPGKEVFCRYILKNPKQELPISILKDGYEIVVPYREGTKLNISDEEWRDLQKNDPAKLHEMYKNLLPEVSSLRLLDIEDGGNGGSLFYREQNNLPYDDDVLNVMHYVNIDTIETLMNSLTL